VYIDVGASPALGARTAALPFDLLFDRRCRKCVKQFKDSAAVAALIGAESQIAVNGGTAPVCCPAIFADSHLIFRPNALHYTRGCEKGRIDFTAMVARLPVGLSHGWWSNLGYQIWIKPDLLSVGYAARNGG